MSVTEAGDTDRDESRSGDTATRMSTAPDPEAGSRIRGDNILAVLRRSWRQLTSMRTALLLLFLLAVAAIPGSLLPQSDLNAGKVTEFVNAHRTIGPVLRSIGLFDVFAAPWFAAIYLLLFISLVGCLVPRIRLHARALRRRPPAAPRNLGKLPHADSFDVDAAPADAAGSLRRSLRGWRTEVRDHDDGSITVSAEKGYLRETGNLVFHVALIVLLIGVAIGSFWGWRAGRLLVDGQSFCTTPTQFDSFTPGRLISGPDLPKFCVTMNKFNATYQLNNQPRSFDAKMHYGRGSGAIDHPVDVSVNHPLRLMGVRTYLIDHGYAPKITVTDPSGQSFTSSTPFLPADASLVSDGVVKLPDASPKQIGIQGVFTPTRDPSDRFGLRSLSPAPYDPALSLVLYEGNLGLDSGIPQSVYTLDQQQIDRKKLKVVTRKVLTPGQSVTAKDGTKVRFDGYAQWASFQVADDPGQPVVLLAAVMIVAGLLCSLRVRRRRMWFRIAPEPPGGRNVGGVGGGCVISAGGLSRSDPETFSAEFARVVTAARNRSGAAAVAARSAQPPLPPRKG